MEPPQMKIVGKLRVPKTPEERLRRAESLIDEMDELNPFPRPRGFIAKFKTYQEYERWRKEQANPRLW